MWPLFWRSIKDRRNSLIAYCIAGIGFLWMYVSLFPFIKDQAESLNKMMASYPDAFKKMFGGENLNFSNLEYYISMEYFSMIWPILVFVFIIAIAGSAFAGEIEKATIEILLSQPISRLKMFISKYLFGVFNLVVFTGLTIYSIIPLAAIYNIDFQMKNFAVASLLCLMLGLAVFSFSMLLSVIFSDKGKVYFISGGLIVVMYVLNIVSNLKDSIHNLKYASIFYYYDSSKAMTEAKIDNLSIIVFLGAIFLFTILAAFIFSKRDISV